MGPEDSLATTPVDAGDERISLQGRRPSAKRVGPGFLLEISNLDSCTQFAHCITAKTAIAFIDHTLSELPCPNCPSKWSEAACPPWVSRELTSCGSPAPRPGRN